MTLRKLAIELRKNAKRQRIARRSVDSVIDFAMITSSSAEELSQMRAHYSRQDGDGKYELTSWPYTLTDMKKLLDLCRQVANIPRSQRKFLYNEFWRNRSAAESAYRSLVKKMALSNLTNSLKGLGSVQPEDSPFSGKERSRTVLLDVLEVAELVGDRRVA